MKKVFDQTVRELKREVNKKVLKVPGIEQKVLDATSNEPWGPHGTLLADIAQATRNYHEYQMIMTIIWKRINDTGKNWRHVYKALTVLEYLVAHGSERVIDDIKEHAYQISTLSSFHYIDSNGRDQGNNVKRKSQSLVQLVNDKERIVEVRQKAAANRDKFRSTSGGGMYRPGYGDRYDDDRYEGRYGSRDEDRNGYGRDREYNYRDEDRYGRYGEGERYGRDYEDRYGYRDDDYQGRSRSIDGGSSRGRSVDRDGDRGVDDDGQPSSRGLERKYSEQNIGAPPSYEETVGESRSPAYGDRNGEATTASAPESSSPPAPRAASPPLAKAASPTAPIPASPPAPLSASPPASSAVDQTTTPFGSSVSPTGQDVDVVDEFDPRGPISAAPSFTAAPTNSNSAEMDLLGALSDSFSNPLAIMPAATATTTNADYQTNLTATHSVPKAVDPSFEDPFGDSPFKAVASTETNTDPKPFSAFAVPFQANASSNTEVSQAASTKAEFGFGDSFSVSPYPTSSAYPPSTNSQFLPQELSNSNQETDILAGILPPSGPSAVVASQAGFSAPVGQPTQSDASVYGGINALTVSAVPTALTTGPQVLQFSTGTSYSQGGSMAPFPSNVLPQTPVGPATHIGNGSLLPQPGPAPPAVQQNVNHPPTGPSPQLNSGYHFPQQSSLTPVASQVALQNPAGPAPQQGNGVIGGFIPQGSPNLAATQVGPPSSSGPLAVAVQPSKDKFETKSTVWADTLSRGLVNLNISGPKTNPLADIGVDFDAINRKEKRMEKQTTTTVTSTVTMGKAMGSGSGIGRAGASALRASQNAPMMGSGMGMTMAGAPGLGMGVGGYGGLNQTMGMGMGMNMGMNPGMAMNMGVNPGMAMNMGMGQGGQIRPSAGLAPGAAMPGSYNPMMGSGGYTQQPYGYR